MTLTRRPRRRLRRERRLESGQWAGQVQLEQPGLSEPGWWRSCGNLSPRGFQTESPLGVTKLSQPLVILEISTICSLNRKYVRASIIHSSCSVLIRCFKTSTFRRNSSRDIFFWCLGLNADSMASDSIFIHNVSMVA